MIESLYGSVVYRDHESVTMNVHGVGYHVLCADPLTYQVNEADLFTIYIYTHVREDAIRLYGFKTREERVLFSRLLQVSGIGPKGALAVLAEGNAAVVVGAIEEENETLLTKFPGIGKKTARQMILDLKGKLDFVQAASVEPDTRIRLTNDALDEAMDALRALGYGEREVKKAEKALKHEDLESDEYVRRALRLFVER
ncbi:Holliday junction branch migration protein RuvA [Geomicrobium sp. JCM 19039]|uniref:Holliday junction branch migration protein RuvA n=1 Tax=Geomicrobium sp. JCM 19039 TaxID=1460636 RepID=UPI00045F45C4|nr:Holliday junction branch migration protein RuvA [Geomicrobium sp. JCM 19039]GAK11304.1 Holliday junction DNA helicase RuvA [Geomicrobium sp. JCM 19039]